MNTLKKRKIILQEYVKKWAKYEVLTAIQMKYPSTEHICIIYSYLICFRSFQEPLCGKCSHALQ